jgi:hypothetical protein
LSKHNRVDAFSASLPQNSSRGIESCPGSKYIVNQYNVFSAKIITWAHAKSTTNVPGALNFGSTNLARLTISSQAG